MRSEEVLCKFESRDILHADNLQFRKSRRYKILEFFIFQIWPLIYLFTVVIINFTMTLIFKIVSHGYYLKIAAIKTSKNSEKNKRKKLKRFFLTNLKKKTKIILWILEF